MKLTYFRGAQPNFGDELNATMWHSLLPQGFLDEDETQLFLGIGSILWDDYPKAPIKHVIGSGYGGYTGVPAVRDGSWNIVWLRGPLTAAHLGVDPRLAITDAAVLLRATPLPDPAPGVGVAFMPHFESVARGNWARACALAGITYLDPRDPTGSLLARIRGARLLITEAMHGAIVADALRTPFIALMPNHPEHRAKWQDWAQSLGIGLRQAKLPPSTVADLYVRLTGLKGQGRRTRQVSNSAVMAPVNYGLAHVAAARLRWLADRMEPQLSADAEIARATDRCLEALAAFSGGKGR